MLLAFNPFLMLAQDVCVKSPSGRFICFPKIVKNKDVAYCNSHSQV